MTDLIRLAERVEAEASKLPARVWATCNGMSTRLPDGHRQFVGGWSEDKDRPRAEQFIRADLVESLVEALRKAEELYQVGLLNAPDGLADEVVSLRRTALRSIAAQRGQG